MSGSNQLICRAAVLALLLCASGAEPAAADEATPRDFTFTFMRTTFSDDASSGKPAHLWSMDQLRAAGPEMENYFRLVSNGKLRLHVRVAEAPDLGPRASYVTGEAIENAALDSAHNAGYDAAITGTQALYFLERGYAGGNCNAYYGLHAVTHQMTALLGEMAVQEGCGRGSVSPDPAGRSGVDWSGFEQEVGHDLQHITGRAIIHPAGYGDSFNMMDSCYPCSESAFDLAPATVVGGNVAPFPGWLPSTKYSILTPTAAELATGGSRTVNLAPVEADPTTTPLAQGLKIPYAAIDVPVSATERWHGERYYMLSLHRRIRAGAYGPASSPRMADEGVEIHEVMESRNPPVQMVPPCEQAPAPVRCVYLPDAAHDGSYCDTHPSPPGPRLTECWPYVLWHPGDTYHGLAGTDISFGATTASGAQPVIVTRGRASGPDPFIIPDHSPPMNTAETVDLWIDSSCNGYEYSRRGHYYLRTNPSALRYGRRSAPTLEGETVVANGDDLCGNHENRIYARIHNAGNGTARDVRVKLGISRTSETPGAGAVWDEIGTTGPVDI
ncbi:MAG: hypothetical protein QOG68_1727, partial [Solirubrobacteraceae bacterium]|nr:hypothetical protein [Solirubrobacteraceae bacterium]